MTREFTKTAKLSDFFQNQEQLFGKAVSTSVSISAPGTAPSTVLNTFNPEN